METIGIIIGVSIGVFIGVFIIIILLVLLTTYLIGFINAVRIKKRVEKILAEKGVETIVKIGENYLTKK